MYRGSSDIAALILNHGSFEVTHRCPSFVKSFGVWCVA